MRGAVKVEYGDGPCMQIAEYALYTNSVIE